MIHFKDRSVATGDGKEFPHDGTPGDRRRAISEAQQHIARVQEASNRRSLAERGRPATLHELEYGWKPDDPRGPHERQADTLAATVQYNPYQARLDILKAQRITSKEIPALEGKAASWQPPAPVEVNAEESPFAGAIASLLARPGATPAEKQLTEKQVANLRAAEDRWKQDQAAEAELKLRQADPLFLNAVQNAESAHRAAELLPNIPQGFVNGTADRLKTLKESGDVDAYWRDTRAAEAELNVYFDKIDAEYKARGVKNEEDRKAALSRLPVEAPQPVEPPKSAIEQALTGGSTTPPAPEANHA
jgi:hypothetical protein